MSGTYYHLILSAHQHCSHLSHGSKNMIFLLICQNLQFSISFYISCVFHFFKFYFCIKFWFYYTVYMCHTYCAVLVTILVLLLNKFDLIWFEDLVYAWALDYCTAAFGDMGNVAFGGINCWMLRDETILLIVMLFLFNFYFCYFFHVVYMLLLTSIVCDI